MTLYPAILRYGRRIADAVVAPIIASATFITVAVVLYLVDSYVIDYPVDDKAVAFGQLLLGLYLYALLLMALPVVVGRWLRGAGYVVMYGMCAVETFLVLRFNMRISPSMIMLMMDTNANESQEFLTMILKSGELWGTLGIYSAVGLCHGLGLWARRHHHSHRHSYRYSHSLRLLALPVFLAAMVSIPGWWERQQRIVPYLLSVDTRNAEHCSETNFYSAPLRFEWSLKFYRLMVGEADIIARRTEQVRVDSCTFRSPQVIFIIGESYNRHHASLYGYPLPTTPFMDSLAGAGHLVAFIDAVTPWNLTSNVFKDIMSTQSAADGGNWTDGVLFPAVFKRAGYHVSFLSNQFYAKRGQANCDVNGSFFLNRSDMDALCFDERSSHHFTRDGSFLTKELTPHVHRPHELLILHLYGQHMTYRDRSPYAKKKLTPPFTPADYHRADLDSADLQTLADYDNACRYNDEMIGRIYGAYRQEEAVFVYIGDHGEYVYDGADVRFGRSHGSTVTREMARNEFEVPLILFFSPAYAAAHPDVVAAARAARQRPAVLDDIPHLLMGLAGIATPHYSPRHDILAPDYDVHRRRLLRGHDDYDALMAR